MFAFSSLSFNTLFCICFQYFDGRPHAFHLRIRCQGNKTPLVLQLQCVLAARSLSLLRWQPVHHLRPSSGATLTQIPPSSSVHRNEPLTVPDSLFQPELPVCQASTSVGNTTDVLLTCVTLWTFRANASLFRLHPLCLWSFWRCRCLPSFNGSFHVSSHCLNCSDPFPSCSFSWSSSSSTPPFVGKSLLAWI